MTEFDLIPITLSIIVITTLISILGFSKHDVKNKMIFYPYGMRTPSEYYRFISHGLIHADFIHLFFNMFTLYSFGAFVEQNLFNRTEYIVLYVTALIAASVYDFIKNRNNSGYAALGASGAVSAIIFASIIFDPWFRGVVLFGIPNLAIPNIAFAVLYICGIAFTWESVAEIILGTTPICGAAYMVLHLPHCFAPNCLKNF